MRLTSVYAIREQVYALLNLAAADVTTADKAKLGAFIARRGREAFQFYWWPETMRMEDRFYRAPYAAATAYAVTNEVYYAASRTYYQALRTTTGNAPATLTAGSYTTNTAYWATVGQTSGADWADATLYSAGDTVRNPADGVYYRCHTAHVSNASFDATKFGLVSEWLPYISLDQAGRTPIGQVRGCFLDHPARVANPRRVGALLGPNGIHLPQVSTTSVVVWFQIKPPILTGGDYAAGTAYTVVGTTVYYASATPGYEGDYWTTVAATTAGQSPETTPAAWQRQEIPEGLRDAIAHAAYGDMLRPVDKSGDVPLESGAGAGFLADEMRKVVAMQQQAGKWRSG